MLNYTLLESNHIGLFGFEEEPKLSMCHPSRAAAQAKAFSRQLKNTRLDGTTSPVKKQSLDREGREVFIRL